VDGHLVVEDGALRTIGLDRVVERHGRIAARMLR
jgi:hypothetical protein